MQLNSKQYASFYDSKWKLFVYVPNKRSWINAFVHIFYTGYMGFIQIVEPVIFAPLLNHNLFESPGVCQLKRLTSFKNVHNNRQDETGGRRKMHN
jgi:hypothetical protein